MICSGRDKIEAPEQVIFIALTYKSSLHSIWFNCLVDKCMICFHLLRDLVTEFGCGHGFQFQQAEETALKLAFTWESLIPLRLTCKAIVYCSNYITIVT